MKSASLIALLSLVLMTSYLVGCSDRGDTSFRGNAVDPPAPPPSLTATNWDGSEFDLETLSGRPAIVFFGYTYCPDVCPMTLAKMKQVYAALGDRAEEVAVIFVSVDPERDTIDKLASYVPRFDPRFFGLRLDDEQMDAVRADFNLTVQFGQPSEGPGTDSYYYVDHTGTYFLLDRLHRIRVELPPDATVEEIVPDVEVLLRES